MTYQIDFAPITRHRSPSNDFPMHATHQADFEVIDGGRRYWGWVVRYFDRAAADGSRVSLEVALFTANSRTQFGVAVREGTKVALRAAAVKAFKAALADWLEAGEPNTYQQRAAKLAQQAQPQPQPEALEAPAPQPSPSSLEVEALAEALRAAAISDLIKAGRAALFALEGVALLQGNREVAAYALQLGQALAPFAEGAALEGLSK